MVESLKRKDSKNSKRKHSDKRAKKVAEPIQPTYIFDGPFRRVEPYEFLYEAHAKGRWIGRDLASVFKEEFRDRSHAYYAVSIDQGRIRVNGNIVGRDHKVDNHDLLSHRIHRHEPPILATPIEIVCDTEDMLVVNKPASLPVHPAGRFQMNTLVRILKHEMGYESLHPINRIDRLTSGLVLIAKNRYTAQSKAAELQSRTIQKTYLCRVRGNFPDEEITCDQPLAIFAHKVGVNHVSADGKPSTTVFKKRSFNGCTSVVECRPLTGRSHQIRVHLQYLGYPIANDPLYASDVWGPDGGKGNLSKERLSIITAQLSKALATDPKGDEEQEEDIVPCLDCSAPPADPDPETLHIWLHSLKYVGHGWCYETKEPDWAKEDFDGDRAILEKFKVLCSKNLTLLE